MHCKSCEILIEDAIKDLGSIKKVKASHKTSSVFIDFDNSKLSKDDLIKVINKEGYGVMED